MSARAGLLRRLLGLTALREAGAAFGLLALLFQMGVPLAHDPAGLGLLDPLADAPLCHVGAPGDRQSSPSQPDQGVAICPLCLGIAASGVLLMPPSPGIAVIAAVAPAPLADPVAFVRKAHGSAGSAQPRAPPVLA